MTRVAIFFSAIAIASCSCGGRSGIAEGAAPNASPIAGDCAERAVEARTNLKAIFTAMKSKFAETLSYPTSLSASGWAPPGSLIYTYSLALTSNGFVATATGSPRGDATVDIWTIDEKYQLVNTTPGCN
jgi:hypothetical protein